MDLSAFLAHPLVHDVRITPNILFVITSDPEETPTFFADREVILLTPLQALKHPRAAEILSAKSAKETKPVLIAHTLYEYDVSSLSAHSKQKFSHALNGTGGRKSFLSSVQGKRLGKGVLLIPEKYTTQVDEFLHKYDVQWKATTTYTGDAS